MGREIKFRAWDKETEEFVYSDEPFDDVWMEFKDGKLGAFALHGMDSGSMHAPPMPICDDLEPVQQFTGLKDSKGVDIYEGDILKAHHPNEQNYFKGTPVWVNELSRYNLETDKFSIAMYEFEDFEIIGNIYENPNLVSHKSENMSDKPD